MSRETQNVLVLLLGLGTGVMVAKGTYVHYVRPLLMPWLLLASAAVIALALISIVRDIRRHDTETHEHRHRGRIVWLLLVPVAASMFVIPPPLGPPGATHTVAAAEPHSRAFRPLPPGRAPAVPLPEVMTRAVADSAGTLNGRLITVTGFKMSGSGGPDLGRVVIVCCAADAQLAQLHLSGPDAAAAAGYPEDTWLQIEGTVVPGSSTASTSFVPTMTVSSVTKINPPANTYAY